ncbi:hypothetical protein HAX54_036269, partial [Datura stramonium]|nr:hypothetical protein [Datura stramonium]
LINPLWFPECETMSTSNDPLDPTTNRTEESMQSQYDHGENRHGLTSLHKPWAQPCRKPSRPYRENLTYQSKKRQPPNCRECHIKHDLHDEPQLTNKSYVSKYSNLRIDMEMKRELESDLTS